MVFCLSRIYRIPQEGGFVYPLLHIFFLCDFRREKANRLHTLSLNSIKTIPKTRRGYAVALLMARFSMPDIGVPGPAPPGLLARRGPGPLAPCAALPGLCAGLLRSARPCPPPPGLRASPPPCRLPSVGWGGARSGRPGLRPASRAPARFRAAPPGRSPPRLAGLGLSARGRARRSGPPSPPPPRLAALLGPAWGGGRGPPRPRGSLALPSARFGLAARALASLRARLGPLRGSGSGGSPPFRPAPAGRLRPPSSAPGAARRPSGGFLAAPRPPALRRSFCGAAPGP